jgi:hypothetical protein
MKAWLKAPFLSPAGLLVRAAAIALVYAVVRLAGLQDHATVLSGGLPYEGASPRLSTVLGAFALLSHFAGVVAAPVFVLGAGILRVLLRLFADRAPDSRTR